MYTATRKNAWLFDFSWGLVVSTIINLYVMPGSDVGIGGLRAVIDVLVDESMLEFPAIVGMPVAEGRIVGTQAAVGGFAPSQFMESAKRCDSVQTLRESLGRSSGSVLVAFAGLRARHPKIATEFPHYQGRECAVGFYCFDPKFRLVLEPEFAEEALWDAETSAWIHFQGKAAPWEEVFSGSSLETRVKECWSNIQIVEDDWV